MIPRELSKYLKGSFNKGKVACLTGAGISAESGIPTFRGKGGLWEKYDPALYANLPGLVSLLRKSPTKLVDFVCDFYTVLLKAKPNPAHLALAVLERENRLSALITQNIDNLHQESGSRNVIELHGNAFRIRCMDCSKTITLEKDRLKEMVAWLSRDRDSYFKIRKILSRYFPRCVCSGRYRIDIVLFGELLPQEALSKAYQYLKDCDTLLVVGSSLVIYPAAELPLYAKENGARIIEINSEPSALSDICDYKIFGQASEILPEIAKLINKSR